MIKLLILILFIAVVVAVTHDVMLNTKIKYIDDLVRRGVNINSLWDKF